MDQNVGFKDKIIRYILAAIFITLGIIHSYYWFIPAAIMLFTATIGWCGLYKLFGINTCPVTKPKKVAKKTTKRKK